MKRTHIITISIVLLATALLAITTMRSTDSTSRMRGGPLTGHVTLYKSPSCGCCSLYTDYAHTKGKLDIDVKNVPDITTIKNKYNIPKNMQSCHTMIIGDYFVEGHVPVEAIEKLMNEQPDIAGIAMPGMPSGSPGMPGTKTGDFIIYAINHNGDYEEFMRI